MKVLLLKPISDTYYVIQPNLGLGYLARIILDNGHSVEILDSGREKLTWTRFEGIVKEGGYDLIGIQMFTHEVMSAKKHIAIIKKHSPKSIVVIGGAHVSGDPERAMKFLDKADFGFIGEAEIGAQQFTSLKKEDYANEKVLRGIPNLVWRQKGSIVVNERRFLKNLDEIKYPAWQLMPPSIYPTAPHGSFARKKPIAPMIISRGCPFQCTFCAGKCVTGTQMRYRSLENVRGEIMLLHNKYGVREFHIEDDNFTLNRGYVADFCRQMINLKLDITFALPNGIRLDSLDKNLLELMERAGFYSFAVGVESGSDRVLKLMKKNLSTKA
ncbi:B12-binding domain-containing radical SAM protein, partial [Candidatus Woesearchaeota archaeon]|nr:B12-binding domain-containing radical SAM protein [Candidatus Woesearchaeota archaeon]